MDTKQNIFEITGVVLAGGESSRMGEDKSVMLFREQQLIKFSLSALEPYCKDLFISSSKSIHQDFNYRIFADEHKNIGPIAGIHSSLKNTSTDYIIILPCDSPMIKKKFIEFLISMADNKVDALVPMYDGHLEPLFSIYHRRILPAVEEQIEKKDYKLANLLQKINAKIIEVQDRSCFVNINTPADFNKYLPYA